MADNAGWLDHFALKHTAESSKNNHRDGTCSRGHVYDATEVATYTQLSMKLVETHSVQAASSEAEH